MIQEQELESIIEGMLADGYSEDSPEIQSVIQQFDSEKKIEDAQEQSNKLKKEYNFSENIPLEDKKPTEDQEDQEVISDESVTTETDNEDKVKISADILPDVNIRAVDKTTTTDSPDIDFINDDEIEEKEIKAELAEEDQNFDDIIVDLDFDEIAKEENTEVQEEAIQYNPEMNIKLLDKEEKEEFKVAENKKNSTTQFLNGEYNQEEYVNSKLGDDFDVTLFKRNIGDGWVVYSNLSVATLDPMSWREEKVSPDPLVRTNKNPDDAWEHAYQLGQYWSFTSEDSADAFINSKTDVWGLVQNNEIFNMKDAQNILKGKITSPDKILKYKSPSGPNLELSLFHGARLTPNEFKYYKLDFDSEAGFNEKRNKVIDYTKKTLSFEKKSKNVKKYPETFKDLSDTSIKHLLDGISFVKQSINGIVGTNENKTIFTLLNSDLYNNEIQVLKDLIEKAIDNPTAENIDNMKTQLDRTANGEDWADIHWYMNMIKADISNMRKTTFSTSDTKDWIGSEFMKYSDKVSMDFYTIDNQYLFPGWKKNKKARESAKGFKDFSSYIYAHTNRKFKTPISNDNWKRIKKNAGKGNIFLTSKELSYADLWNSPTNNLAWLIGQSGWGVNVTFIINEEAYNNFVNREGYYWYILEGGYRYGDPESFAFQPIGLESILSILSYGLNREYVIYEDYANRYNKYQEQISKENLYSIIGESGKRVAVNGQKVLNEIEELSNFLGTKDNPNAITEEIKENIETKTKQLVNLSENNNIKSAHSEYVSKLLEISFKYNLELERYKNTPLLNDDGSVMRFDNGNPVFPKDVEYGENLILAKEKELEALANAESKIAYVEFQEHPDVKNSAELFNYLTSEEVTTFIDTYDLAVRRYNSIINCRSFQEDLEDLKQLGKATSAQYSIVEAIRLQYIKELIYQF